jgi:hypothetical protein
MRLLLSLTAFLMLGGSCHRKTAPTPTAAKLASNCYKARLEIKDICMNYVIKVLDGDLSKLNIEREWKDEDDGTVYTNVFALGSRCSFPDVSEGDEFYFSVTGVEDAGCNVCLAYRPVPAAKNNIVVSKTACP